jgi:hypothetical protein
MKMKKTNNSFKLWVIFAVTAALILASQQRHVSASDFFKQKVAPIFEQRCVLCHSGSVQRSGLDLRNEETILKGGARGPAVVAGSAEKSLVYRFIKQALEAWRFPEPAHLTSS